MKNNDLFHVKNGKEFTVKELFKDFSGKIKEHFNGKTENISLLDVGCASGELPYFLKNDLRTSGKVWGFDISEELIENARERFGDDSGINFFVDDASCFKLDETFDAITMSSVLSLFDDPYPIFVNILHHLNDGGVLLISGIFNSYNIDVRMRYKLDGDEAWYDCGVANQFSKKRIAEFLDKNGYRHTFSTQIMPFDISKPELPVRSWTVNVNNERWLTSGLQLLYNIEVLEITKK